MDLQDILSCPRTGHRLRFDEAAALVRVEHSDLTYPIIEGIIDRFEELDRRFPGFRIIQRGQDQSFAWFEAVAC